LGKEVFGCKNFRKEFCQTKTQLAAAPRKETSVKNFWAIQLPKLNLKKAIDKKNIILSIEIILIIIPDKYDFTYIHIST
jgi:hypothetical protein